MLPTLHTVAGAAGVALAREIKSVTPLLTSPCVQGEELNVESLRAGEAPGMKCLHAGEEPSLAAPHKPGTAPGLREPACALHHHVGSGLQGKGDLRAGLR